MQDETRHGFRLDFGLGTIVAAWRTFQICASQYATGTNHGAETLDTGIHIKLETQHFRCRLNYLHAPDDCQLLQITHQANEILNELMKTPEIGQEIPVELKEYQEFLKAMALLWLDPQSNSEFKERIIKKLVSRIEIDNDSVDVHFFVGKSYFGRELKAQIVKNRTNFEKVGSSTCQNGAREGTRTPTIISREILNLLCLPFHHPGIRRVSILMIQGFGVNYGQCIILL